MCPYTNASHRAHRLTRSGGTPVEHILSALCADPASLAALFAGMDPKLGKAVLQYLRLFSPAKRSLRTTKAIRLVEDLLALVTPGSVTRDGRTTDTRRATPTLLSRSRRLCPTHDESDPT